MHPNGITKKEILKQLRIIKKKLGKIPNRNEFTSMSGIGRRILESRFGSWNNLLLLAGEKQNKKYWSKKECLELIRLAYRRLGKIPSYSDVCEISTPPTYKVYTRLFGGFVKAREMAGIKNRLRYNASSKRELIKQLQRLANKIKKRPSETDIDAASNCASSPTFRKAFGTLLAARKAAKVQNLKPRLYSKNKICEVCHKRYTIKTETKRKLEYLMNKRRYCSTKCKRNSPSAKARLKRFAISEKRRKYQREYVRTHKELIRKSQLKFAQSEKHKRYLEKYYSNPLNLQKRKDRALDWQRANPEKVKCAQKKYRATTKGRQWQVRHTQVRRKKFSKIGGSDVVPLNVIEVVDKRDKACVYCGKKFLKRNKGGGHRDNANYDHFNPNMLHSLINTVKACGACNSSKRDLSFNQWLKTDYCRKNKITRKSVSKIVLELLRKQKARKQRTRK